MACEEMDLFYRYLDAVEEAVERVLLRDARYPSEAYVFLRAALSLRFFRRGFLSDPGPAGHATVEHSPDNAVEQQLADAFREPAFHRVAETFATEFLQQLQHSCRL